MISKVKKINLAVSRQKFMSKLHRIYCPSAANRLHNLSKQTIQCNVDMTTSTQRFTISSNNCEITIVVSVRPLEKDLQVDAMIEKVNISDSIMEFISQAISKISDGNTNGYKQIGVDENNKYINTKQVQKKRKSLAHILRYEDSNNCGHILDGKVLHDSPISKKKEYKNPNYDEWFELKDKWLESKK